MAVTLNSNGVTFGDGSNQNTATSGGVTFGATQFTGYNLYTTAGPNANAWNPRGLGLPSTSVVVGADIIMNRTPRPSRIGPDPGNAQMRFRYKTLS